MTHLTSFTGIQLELFLFTVIFVTHSISYQLTMALPPDALELKGGCLCKAVRYIIKVPHAEKRGVARVMMSAKPTDTQGESEDNNGKPAYVNFDFPLLSLDHCSDCRHAAGTPAQAWIICPQEWIEWDVELLSPSKDGVERVKQTTLEACSKDGRGLYEDKSNSSQVSTYQAKYPSSEDVTRTFCSRCGTNLTYFAKRPASDPNGVIVDVTIGSMDDESSAIAPPNRQAWCDSGVGWFKQLVREGGPERLWTRNANEG
ncbi:uncharacterized protein GIQ15_00934 [Arthroderma uncinatum]|uniref:uncharacterized protein n=1 Tax=Arthroderma uncinatum TaxID=74035 RepID=UPI00144AB96E|nr:uncharacterized protein GIQ15_00934 [Arthroderma uncinatum]KAF3491417.1 hypothetical protein GIQ15_00934 [Arthroderma uncinatum]